MTATILRFPDRLGTLPGADLGPGALADPPSPPPVTGWAHGKRVVLTPRPLDRPPRALSPAESALQDRMLQAYFMGARAAQNHAATSIKADLGRVQEFLSFVGQPLWACTPDDFEAWASALALSRHLAAGTQRTKQTAVAVMYDYLVHHPAWQNQVHALCGGRIQQVATSGNRVIHTTDQGTVHARRYLTAEELTRVFDTFAAEIARAVHVEPRCVRQLQRDRAMFFTYYAYGLRLDEGYTLNVSSFFANPDLPELGDFGCVGVFGKGSRGSGKRYRVVPTVLPDLRVLLEWYLTTIRPQFPIKDDDAMWLSERGDRLAYSTVSARFKNMLLACGIDPRTLSMHGLRHMSVSHQAEAGVPLAYTARTHGHRHASTTQTYTHLSDSFMRNIARRLVDASLDPPEAP